MKGNSVICEGFPQGKWRECVIDGTPLAGSIVEITPGAALENGRYHVRVPVLGSDGFPGSFGILDQDSLQGFSWGQAYVSGRRGRVYFPLHGEEVNVLVGEAAGTGNDIAIGDKFMVDADGHGLIPVSGSPICVPFESLEVITDTAEPVMCFGEWTM